MRLTLSIVLLSFLFSNGVAQTQSFFDFSVKTIEGETISLSKYAGRKIMVVNTASFCGYTPQLGELEELYKKYKADNFVIIGFPCNNFGHQDPEDNIAIKKFCTENYGVTFPMMAKVDIVKNDTVQVYKWLQRAGMNGKQDVSVKWNFNKFLIDENGTWIMHLGSKVKPMDSIITNWITGKRND